MLIFCYVFSKIPIYMGESEYREDFLDDDENDSDRLDQVFNKIRFLKLIFIYSSF